MGSVATLTSPVDSAAAAPEAAIAPREPSVGVSVLVPVLDEQDAIEASVAAMLAQDTEHTIELLMIDGRSSDDTVAILRRLQADDPRIRILDNPRRTTAHALNVGLRAARGRFVARMDAHTTYPPGYLRHGIARLAAGDVAWVTGPQIPTGDGYWSGIVAIALGGQLGRGASDKWAADDADAPAEEWDLTTSVFTGVWERETLDALGGWDGAWPVNQDSEMAARVLAQGGRIVCRREMGAAYVPRNGLRRLARQYRRYGSYRARTFVRHPSSCGPARLAASGLPLALLAALLPGPRGRLARRLTAAYLAAVVAQVLRARPAPADALPLGLVLVTMHVSWGAGFLQSVVRTAPRRRRLRATLPTPLHRPA
jgi:succinoglycan biosynthesis protein ExoA